MGSWGKDNQRVESGRAALSVHLGGVCRKIQCRQAANISFVAKIENMKYLLLALPILAFSCRPNQQEPMVGGPCTYATTYHPAKVIHFDAQQMDAQFEVQLGSKTDTLGFYELNNSYLTQEQVQQSGMAVGKVFKLAEDNITSGTCTPNILRIELAAFDGGATQSN